MYSDGSLARYLTSDSLASPLSDPTGLGKYLPGYEVSEPQTANQSVFGKATGGIGRYLEDGKH